MLSFSPWFTAFPAGHPHAAATSPAVAVSVQNWASTSSYGQAVELTATVAGATTGSVEFFDGTTQLSTAVNVSGRGIANYVTSTLAVGTHAITAQYFASGAAVASATSTAVPETVNAASIIPVSLRGGAMLTIDITQALNSTAGTLTESGAGVTYVDSARNINLTSTSITSVLFSSNGYQAEITAAGNNVTTDSSGNTVTTPVNFTLIVSSGSGQGYSLPSANISITGSGISYRRSGTVSSGSISVNATTASITSILPSTSDGGGPSGRQGGWGGGGGPGCGRGGWGGGGGPGGGQGGWGDGGQGSGGSGSTGTGSGSGGSGSTGTGSTGTGSTGTGSTGTGSTGTGSTGTGSTGTGSTGTGSGGSGSGRSSSTTTTSSNWSGYAAETNLNGAASGSVTAVNGTWKVPTATANGSTSTAYSSVWVGIDGYSSSSVEQIGTDSDIVNGQAQYYVWYEMYPSASENVTGMTISAGDTINASVTYLTSGAHAGQFQLTITDASKTNDTFTIYQTASSAARSSAEWVVEAPSSTSGVLPLANFGSVTFTNATATINGKTGPIDSSTWQNASINMASGSTVEASTSGLTDSGAASSFTVAHNASSAVTPYSYNTLQTWQHRSTVRQSNVAPIVGSSSGRSLQPAFQYDPDLRARDAIFAMLDEFRA
ncbi:MAG: G1 family glutamic endopeptidase [Thermoguttaceae bacterium]